jgi:hypothetical protein
MAKPSATRRWRGSNNQIACHSGALAKGERTRNLEFRFTGVLINSGFRVRELRSRPGMTTMVIADVRNDERPYPRSFNPCCCIRHSSKSSRS